jgi:hypothetical protein
MTTELLHRLQEGALSARKTPEPPAPTSVVPVANVATPTAPPPESKEK